MTIVNMELLVGRKVRDVNGRICGRLEDVHADWRGGECIVTHYTLASKDPSLLTFVLRWLGAQKNGGGVVVPWDRLDLTTMQLSCRIEELAV